MKMMRADISRPVELLTCGNFYSDVEWTHNRRCLDSFEIVIGVNKTLHISLDNENFDVSAGDVLLLPPGVIHGGYRPCEPGVSFFWFHFHVNGPYEFLDEQAFQTELSELNKPDTHQQSHNLYLPIYYSPASIERANILFQQLQHLNKSNYYTQAAVHFTATSLLIELSEQMISGCLNSPDKSQGDRSVAEIIEWIRVHALQDISVSDLADRFMYNKEYLSRFFKKKTGYNLQEYINLMKISKAKDLLSRSSRPIKYISDYVGIEDEKYFMRLFKKHEGLTPTEYRKAFYRVHMNDH